MEQDFIRGTTGRQNRQLLVAAGVTALVVVIAVVVAAVVVKQTDGRGQVRLTVNTPYVAPGVAPGTSVLLHGADVGKVTELRRGADGAVRLTLEMDPERTRGLTDHFQFDYRPANYFGVTALNVTPGTGGARLANGQTLNIEPEGDFSLSTVLQKGSFDVNGTLTNDLIASLNKVITYTNGFDPIIETFVRFADQVAQTQKALPAILLDRFNSVAEEFPDFSRQVVQGLYYNFTTQFNRRDDGSPGPNERIFVNVDAGLKLGSTALFSAAGTLLRSHQDDLLPAVTILKNFVDVVPGLLDNGGIGPRVSTIVDRIERAFASTPNGGKRVDLRVVLDDLPGVAAPLAAMGADPVAKAGVPR